MGTDIRSFEPGVGRVDDAFRILPKTEYYHGDLIGTTRDVSYKGSSTAPAVYTAFGELVDGTNHRYGYAGAWGYQAHDNFPFLHVGARYYDPGTGRFLQRDPLGVGAGVNVYAYVRNGPTIRIDPVGLWSWRGLGKAIVVGVGGGAGAAAGAVIGGLLGPGGAWFGGVSCGAVGAYASGELYDDLTNPDSLAELAWELDHPPPPIRRKPICLRGCHREPVDY